MKKALISIAVLGLFTLYSIKQHIPSDEVNVVASTTSPTIASSAPSSTQPTVVPQGMYKDGQYTGNVADAYYGNIQVKAIIANGKITDVQFLQYPSNRQTSIEINTQAMPYLQQEAIAAQSAQVDIVSGATDSSQAFRQSLASALVKAQ